MTLLHFEDNIFICKTCGKGKVRVRGGGMVCLVCDKIVNSINNQSKSDKQPQKLEQVALQKWVLTLQAYYQRYSDRNDKESLDMLLGYVSSVNTLTKIL